MVTFKERITHSRYTHTHTHTEIPCLKRCSMWMRSSCVHFLVLIWALKNKLGGYPVLVHKHTHIFLTFQGFMYTQKQDQSISGLKKKVWSVGVQRLVIFKPWLDSYNKSTLVKLRERLWFRLNVKNLLWECPGRSVGRACCVLAAGFGSQRFIAAVKDAAICTWGARSTRTIWSKRK